MFLSYNTSQIFVKLSFTEGQLISKYDVAIEICKILFYN